MKQPEISIIIPTYNESENIIPLILKIEKIIKGYEYEIIIVDDNSKDKTYLLTNKYFINNSRIRCYLHSDNKDLGDSILQGINLSKGKLIIVMDADFNHDPKLLPLLVEKAKEFNFVIASRFIRKGGMEDFFGYSFSLLFNLLLHFLFKFPIYDNTSGYYAINKKLLKSLPLKKIYHGYGEYHIRLVYYASKKNLSICEVPVFYKKRRYGKSKSNHLKMFFSYLYTALNLLIADQKK